jgi:mono/diheme cytochrome c family protein
LLRVRELLVAIAAASFLAASCGRKSESTSADSNTPVPAPATAPAPAPESPGAATATNAQAGDPGTRVFLQRCVLCHGAEGRGDGIGGKALNPRPRNFHDRAYMSTRTDAQLSEVIHNGKGVMPKWGGVLTDDEIAAVLKHVRELGKTK